jgi:hypothetical protein
MQVNEAQRTSGVRLRMAHELKEFAAASLYLYVCIGALLLYKGAVLQAEGISYAPFGLGAIKALILGKFMVMGHALRIGRGFEAKPLIYPILHKSVVFLTVLFALNMAEEAIRGLWHGETLSASVADVGGGTLLQVLAMCLLFFLILLPYFAYREIGRVLGRDTLRQMLLARRTDAPTPGE